MMDFQEFDAELEDWNALGASTPFSGLLIGNGASRAVWEDFAYDSLFENARTVEEKPLSQSELSVFEALQTRSFEQVLGALKTTSRVNKALAVSSAAPRNRYYAIKEALINTVHAVHIPWRLVQEQSLAAINQELRRYPTVFTSNYDLLNYWAVQQDSQGIDDLFHGADPAFELGSAPSAPTRILYLHGGLHLVRNLDGSARKLTSTEGTLLGSFAINNTLKTLDDVPLFVSEGPLADKLKTIRSSDYLSFCYQQLLDHSGALCIFGHNLGPRTATWSRRSASRRPRPWRSPSTAQRGVHPAPETPLRQAVRRPGPESAFLRLQDPRPGQPGPVGARGALSTPAL